MKRKIKLRCKTIRDLILQDKIKQALEELNKLTVLLQSQLVTDEVIQLGVRHKRLVREIAAGILTYEQQAVSFNRLRKTIIDFVQAIEKGDITDEALLSIFKKSYKEFNDSIIINQQHTGSGDNIVGDKITQIYYGENKISRFLTKIPLPDDAIIGREKELESLYEVLEQAQRAVSINGMGGIGKTTTAMAYVNSHKDRYRHLVWVEQIGEFTIDITTNSVLNQNLGFNPTKNSKEDTHVLLNKLANLEGKSLLVIDNANQQVSTFKAYLPKAPDWHILITSREILSFAKSMPLDFLSEADALKLFYTHYTLDKNDEITKAIVQFIDYHTLTLEILAKTAQNRKIISLRTLAKILEERGLQINRQVGLEIYHSRGKKIARLFPYLLTAFELSGELSKDELYLLKQFIALPSTFITWDLLAELFIFRFEDESRFDERWDHLTVALESLIEKGWLIFDKKQQAYMMHRILQEVLLEKLKPTYEALQVLIDNVFFKIHSYKYTPYGVNKLSFSSDAFAERIIHIADKEDKDFARFQSKMGMMHLHLMSKLDFELAEELLESALASDITNFGEQHPTTARSRYNLALMHSMLGNNNKAKELLESALASDITNFGEQHFNTIIRRSGLASIYNRLKEYKKTKDLLESIVGPSIANFGEQHPITVRLRYRLAIAYKNLKDYEKAKELFKTVLNLHIASTSIVGTSIIRTPAMSEAYSNLVVGYQNLENYERAKELFKSVLASNKWINSKNTSVEIYSDLVATYNELDDYKQAMNLMESAITSMGWVKSDYATKIFHSNLVEVYNNLKTIEKAKPLFEQAYYIFKLLLGENHLHTKMVKEQLDNL